MPRLYHALLLPVLWTLLVLPAFGTGKITGSVTDAETGDPLPGVNVILVGTTIGTVTDFDGNYTIINIPPGTYQVQYSLIGFTRTIIDNVRVNTDFTTRQDVVLSEEVIQCQEIVVVAERPLVVKDQTSSAAVVTAEELSSLPVENFSEAVRLQTGVVQGADGGIHIRGGRANEISYIVDGIAVTDPFSGGIGVQVENNAIEELTVVSGTFNAEFGQAQSGVIKWVCSKHPSFVCEISESIVSRKRRSPAGSPNTNISSPSFEVSKLMKSLGALFDMRSNIAESDNASVHPARAFDWIGSWRKHNALARVQRMVMARANLVADRADDSN